MTGFSAIRYASLPERSEALRIAASVLRARWPTVQSHCTVFIAPNSLQAHAVMVWPGVVRVTVRESGELIAASKPGKPFELDPFAA